MARQVLVTLVMVGCAPETPDQHCPDSGAGLVPTTRQFEVSAEDVGAAAGSDASLSDEECAALCEERFHYAALQRCNVVYTPATDATVDAVPTLYCDALVRGFCD